MGINIPFTTAVQEMLSKFVTGFFCSGEPFLMRFAYEECLV